MAYPRRRNGANNKVQRTGILSRPVRLIIGTDIDIRAHFERICMFISLARDGNDLICTHCFGKEQPKVPQPSNPDNPHALSRATPFVL